ncbi:MAG: HDOD domain-containing protein [Desulfobulbaceae bacterium]|nr:HDOD domain-containing protein [Desulfobulbaceae bacterium]HIJ78664.1 HDOD domain-containing protein [Deltaproteobacteria bacterium]
MGTFPSASHKTLTEIFSKVNMSELPAMSNHVQELLTLLNSKQTTAQDLADVILKDASLTTKLLQVVNSAYYSRGVPVTCVSRAITAVGFNTIKELAMTLALFEDFIKAGVEKEEISKLLTKCFLSASQAKILCKAKKLKVVEEEVFICTLLHELGKIIILVYMPELYRKCQALIDRGYSNQFAAKTILNDLTFTQVGMEIARFWNFSEKIVLSMTDTPPQPTSRLDSQLYLLNVAAFCNRLTWIICYGTELELAELILHYGPIFPITTNEAITLMKKGIEAAENISDKIILFGLSKLAIHSKLKEKSQTILSK